MNPKKMKCSFCGRNGADVALIPGEDGNICIDCIERAHELVMRHASDCREDKPDELPPTPSAREIKEFLDRYVIGHDETKKILSVAVHNHYRRLESVAKAKDTKAKDGKSAKDAADDVEIEKSNILLIGPTGTGKTLMAKALAKILGVPFAIGDATVLTQAGYVGEDVENLVRYLLQNAEGDVRKASRGIIYVDEIDKISSKTDNVSITRDVSGEGVQQALLKILEGTICRLPPKGGRKHPDQEYIEIDTSNILFICGGAFVGLDRIVGERTGKRAVGFGAALSGATASGSKKNGADDSNGNGEKGEQDDAILDVRPEDLVKFGLIPEFTGRLPVITVMKELTEDQLVKVLTEPRNALVRQYTKLLAMDGVELEFEQQALRALAKAAISRKTGARGLRAEMERLMTDVMFDASSYAGKKVVVTEAMVREKTQSGGEEES